jgi:transcriptional regulator, tetR family
MGRTQAFDTAEVVRAARDLFWELGFENTPLPDLERVTGLSRSSIYNAFGSKRGLFDAAVANYLDEVVRPLLSPLTADEVAPDALEEYLAGLRAALLAPEASAAANGCLLVRTANTPVGRDDAMSRVIVGYREQLRGGIGRGVQARCPQLSQAEQDVLAEACAGLVVAAMALSPVAPRAAADSLDAALGLIRMGEHGASRHKGKGIRR